MMRRWRGRGSIVEDSLVVEEVMLVKFPSVPFATCLLHLQLLLQGSFHQEEVKQPHFIDIQRPNIMNFLGQAQTLPDGTPPVGKIHTFNKISKTFEVIQRF